MPFIKEAEGVDGNYGVFEDDGETGYLYLYRPSEGIQGHVIAYDRTFTSGVEEDDVFILWSADHAKCGVFVWGKLRAIIDVSTKDSRRVRFQEPNGPGIADPEWVSGFEPA
jgi:hypothetical protein